jgi:hypothetical protein
MHTFCHLLNLYTRISFSPTIRLCPKRITRIGKNKPMHVAGTITLLKTEFLQERSLSGLSVKWVANLETTAKTWLKILSIA